MCMTKVIFPKTFNGINFGEDEFTTEIKFHGNFCKCSRYKYFERGGAVCYSTNGDKNYISISAFKSFSGIMEQFITRYNEEIVECTINKLGDKFKGHVIAAKEYTDDPQWPLGIVVIEILDSLSNPEE